MCNVWYRILYTWSIWQLDKKNQVKKCSWNYFGVEINYTYLLCLNWLASTFVYVLQVPAEWLLRPHLHGNVFGQKRQLSFADAPFVYTKMTKTITKTYKNENALQSGNFENVFESTINVFESTINVFESTVSVSTCKQGKRY